MSNIQNDYFEYSRRNNYLRNLNNLAATADDFYGNLYTLIT